MPERRRSSVLSDEEQQQLEQRIGSRPSAAELHSRGILPKGGKMAAKRAELERQMNVDKLGKHVEHRKSPFDLYNNNVLEDRNVAPALHAAAKKLERNMIGNNLNKSLNHRPSVFDLKNSRILQTTEIAPSVQGVQNQLAKNLTRSNLFHALKHRPSLVELIEKGVYPDELNPFTAASDEEEDDEDVVYDEYGNPHYVDEYGYEQDDDQYYEYDEPEEVPVAASYQRRSKNFHLTRILLKFVASMAEAGEISIEQKGYLKDLIVDQDQTILAVAETFDAENDLHDFKDSLIRLSSRR